MNSDQTLFAVHQPGALQSRVKNTSVHAGLSESGHLWELCLKSVIVYFYKFRSGSWLTTHKCHTQYRQNGHETTPQMHGIVRQKNYIIRISIRAAQILDCWWASTRIQKLPELEYFFLLGYLIECFKNVLLNNLSLFYCYLNLKKRFFFSRTTLHL